MEVLRGRVGGKLEDSLQNLVTLWDRIGISEEERSKYLDDLGQIMDELLTDAVSTTATRLRDMEEDVRRGEAGIVEMNVKLGNGPVGATSILPATASAMERRDSVLAELSEIREFHDARKTHLEELFAQLQHLWTALDEAPQEGFETLSDDLSTARVTEFEGRVAGLRMLASERREQIVDTVSSVQALMVSLKVDASTPLDRQILDSLVGEPKALVSDVATETCVGLSAATFAAVAERHAGLRSLEEERRHQLTELGEAIIKLYERLDVSDTEQDAFAASVHGLGEDTITAGRNELARLRDLMASQLDEMLDLRRQSILKLWDEMGTGPEQRAELDDVMKGVATEELITKAEETERLLTTQAEALRPLLQKIEKRNTLLALRESHAEQMRDPEYQALLTGRSGQARLALKELEATEKKIKHLPKFTEQLKRSMIEWENETGHPFLYNGRRYADQLEDEETKWEEAREKEKRDKAARKRAALENPSEAGPALGHSLPRGRNEETGAPRRSRARGSQGDRENRDPQV